MMILHLNITFLICEVSFRFKFLELFLVSNFILSDEFFVRLLFFFWKLRPNVFYRTTSFDFVDIRNTFSPEKNVGLFYWISWRSAKFHIKTSAVLFLVLLPHNILNLAVIRFHLLTRILMVGISNPKVFELQI